MRVEDLRAFVMEKGIDAKFIEHPGADGLTSEGAASATDMQLSQILKVLCFVDKTANKCFVIIQGSKKVDIRKIPNLKKARIATAQELKEWFNLEPGCVPPIGLPEEIQKYVDVGVKDLPFAVGSAGSRFVGITIKPDYIINQKNTGLVELSL